MSRACQLLGGRAAVGEGVEHLADQGLDLAGLHVGRRLDLDQELPSSARTFLAGVDVRCEPTGLDQGVPEPRSPAAREQVRQDVERRAVGMTARDRVPAQECPRDGFRFRQGEVATPGLSGLADLQRGARDGAARDRAEVRFDPVERLGRLDVADDDQHGAIRTVMKLVKLAEVVGRDPRQVVGPAEDRVPVRVVKVGERQVGLVEPADGRIQVAGALLDDHVPLGLDLAGVERRAAHPVGLDGQGELPAVGRERKIIMGTIFARLGVGMTRRDEGETVDLPLGEAFGPLEEHVLDEVRQARLARRLVHRPDRVIQVADDDRGVTPRQDQRLETVGQGPLEDREVSHPRGGRAGGQSSGHGCPFLLVVVTSAPPGTLRGGSRARRRGRDRPVMRARDSIPILPSIQYQGAIVIKSPGNRKDDRWLEWSPGRLRSRRRPPQGPGPSRPRRFRVHLGLAYRSPMPHNTRQTPAGLAADGGEAGAGVSRGGPGQWGLVNLVRAGTQQP